MSVNTDKLHALGQSLWLDNITRRMLDDGTLARYIAELSISGLTSNPTIFEHAIGKGSSYDEQIAALAREGHSGEELFLQLCPAGSQARGRPVPADPRAQRRRRRLSLARALAAHRRRRGRVDPGGGAPARDGGTAQPLHQDPGDQRRRRGDRGIDLRRRADQRDAALFAGAVHRLGRGVPARIERRIGAGLDPKVHSVASLFVSRWDVAVKDRVAPEQRNRLGIAIAGRTYKAYRELLASPRWQRLAAAGALPQRLLWASTGTKDPAAPDTLYIEALAAPDTINTIPDKTLLAYADHGKLGAPIARGGGDAETVIAELRRQGIDDDALASRLQKEGAEAFAKSWNSLLDGIGEKVSQLAGAASK